MNKTNLILFLFFTLSFISLSQNRKGYKLVWKDEFNGNSLDTLSWNYETGNNGWGNNELQNYTRGENVVVQNGKIRIIAKKENNQYTSSRITTKGKHEFKYGLIEICAKLPKGVGSWPALWMLGTNIDKDGWPSCGEIDIMEHVGKNPGFVHTTIHNNSGFGATAHTHFIKVNNLFKSYHIYGIEWTKEKIVFFIDRIKIYTYTPENKDINNWPFDNKFFVLFNLAVGGNWGGPTVDDAAFPISLDIDYIKVYQK